MTTPFIIASMQRSGTTVLKTLLASHPEISSNQEILKNSVFEREEGIKLIEELPSGDSCRAVGFKLMLNQIISNDWIIDYLSKRDYRVILLHRRPLIDIYLSHEIAKRDNRWSNNRLVEVESIRIDVIDMEQQVRLIRENQRLLDRMFENMNVFRMRYNNVNDEQYHSRILDFLGVDSSIKLRSNQKKVLRKSKENYISNYEEVMETLEKLQLDS